MPMLKYNELINKMLNTYQEDMTSSLYTSHGVYILITGDSVLYNGLTIQFAEDISVSGNGRNINRYLRDAIYVGDICKTKISSFY